MSNLPSHNAASFDEEIALELATWLREQAKDKIHAGWPSIGGRLQGEAAWLEEIADRAVVYRSFPPEVAEEIIRAVAKFPTWPTDPLHGLAVLGEEFGELTKAVLQQVYEPHKNPTDAVRKEAVQVAAMALRFLRSLEVYQYQAGPQHTQGSASNAPGQPAATEPAQQAGRGPLGCAGLLGADDGSERKP